MAIGGTQTELDPRIGGRLWGEEDWRMEDSVGDDLGCGELEGEGWRRASSPRERIRVRPRQL